VYGDGGNGDDGDYDGDDGYGDGYRDALLR